MTLSQYFKFSFPSYKVWKALKQIVPQLPLLMPHTFEDCFENEESNTDRKSFTGIAHNGLKYIFLFHDLDEKERVVSWVITKKGPGNMKVFPQPCIEQISVFSEEPDMEDACEVCWETFFLDPAYDQAALKYQNDIIQNLGHMMGAGLSRQIRPLVSCDEEAAKGKSSDQSERLNAGIPMELQMNEMAFEVLDPKTNIFKPYCGVIHPGQIIKVSCQQFMPADMILLHGENVYIQESKLNGDDKVYARTIASEVLVDLAPLIGSGDATVTQLLCEAGYFEVCSPLSDPDYFHAKYFVTRSSDGGNQITEDKECSNSLKVSDTQFLPKLSKLLVAESCVGMVVFTGEDTVYAQAGGKAGSELRSKVTKRRKERDKKKKELEKHKRADLLATPLDPQSYEQETGIQWEDHFTNVLDDGNCMIHALWLGLTTLLLHYPKLQLDVDAEINILGCKSAADFRTVLLQKLSQTNEYRDSVRNQVGLWLSVDGSVLMALEEFFTMPPEFQSTVMEMNQQVQLMGGAVEDAQIEVLVSQYIDSLMLPQEMNGTVFYNPLGEIEMEFLCQILKVRLQVVKSEALELIYLASQKLRELKEKSNSSQKRNLSSEKDEGKLDTNMMIAKIDPRTIRSEHILDRNAFDEDAQKRVVRILNVNTNHYQVHLPSSSPDKIL